MNWYKLASVYGLQYNPSNNNLELNFFDFYALISMFKSHPLNYIDQIEETVKEFTDISSSFWKQQLLKDVQKCISMEMIHIHDELIQKSDYHTRKTVQALIGDDLGHTFYYAPETTEYDNPVKYVSICQILFSKLQWEPAYGGKSWANICDLWLNLYSSSGKNQIIAIDRMFDAAHNSGNVLDKLDSYDSWINYALDYKYLARSPYDFSEITSPSVKKLISYYRKSRNEEKTSNEKIQIQVINKNPRFILSIKNPSEYLQELAIKKDPSLILKIKNPSENLQQLAVNERPFLIMQFNYIPSEKVQNTAINKYPDLIQYLKNPSEKTIELAISKQPFLINYIKNPSKKLEEIYKNHLNHKA
jgi:uncharacterized ubiquitin-like protein YukD